MAQTNACKVLFMAAATAESAQLAIGHAGGIEACVDSMKEYEDDDIVMEGCLLALSNLCIPEENIPFALEGDLIELGVNAMSKNVENCGLQEHGCAVLANLAVHEEARGRIRECGGCDNIVVSMIVNRKFMELSLYWSFFHQYQHEILHSLPPATTFYSNGFRRAVSSVSGITKFMCKG